MDTGKQLQMHNILDDGTVVNLMPVNTSLDVFLTGISDSGSLKLPTDEDTLTVTLTNIRKYLSNLSSLASTARSVSSDSKDTSTVNIPTTAVTTALANSIDSLTTTVNSLSDSATVKGTASVYGHVKLSDSYLTSGGAAANSVAASSKAVYDAYTALSSAQSTAMSTHSGTKATTTVYGHVILSDTYTTSGGAAASSVGASSKAVYDAYIAASGLVSTHSGEKATASKYSHVILSDTYSSAVTNGAAANAVGASQNALYNAYNTLNTAIAGKAASNHTHSYLPLSGGTVTGATTLSRTTAASGTANNSPALLVGGAVTAAHIEIDFNKVMAKATGTTTAELKLNPDGGAVSVGTGGLKVTSNVTVNAPGTDGTTAYGIYPQDPSTGGDGFVSNSEIGSSTNMWDNIYGSQINAKTITATSSITEAGTTLANKYAAKSHTHSYAPISHATSATTYGVGSTTNYGHLKISDNYTSSAGAAADGVAASSKALYDVYTALNGSSSAVTNHASEKATATKYSHVILSDTYTSAVTNGAAANAVGASQNALYNAYNALDVEVKLRAPKSHATTSTTYGAGTAINYGHVKLSDSYSASAGAAADGVAASSKALYDLYTSITTSTSTDLGTHATERATATTYSHVALSDTYSSLVADGAAANALGASQNALYNAYNTLNTAIAGKASSSHSHSNYLQLAGGTVTGTATFSKTTAASGTASNSPAVVIGGAASSTHIEMDFNKVMAKATGTTTATLYLNPDGGAVSVGAGGLSVSGSITEGGTALSSKYAAASHTHAYAPTSHASTATTYGIGTATNYGHIKLSDSYTSSGGAASAGVGASSSAVYSAYTALNSAKAPTSHASTATTYGIGTTTNYGHIKLSDTYASKVDSAAAANGVGASQNALYNAYNTLNTAIAGKASSSHTHSYLPLSGGTVTGPTLLTTATEASGTADNSPALVVGGAKTAAHIEVDFNKVMAKATDITTAELKLNPDGGAVIVGAGGLSVSGTISEGGTSLSDKYAAKSHTHSYAPTSHASTGTSYGIGTASNYGHVKLSDTYSSSVSSGAAANGMAASQNALYNAYNTLNTAIAGKAASSHTHSYLPLSGGTLTGSAVLSKTTAASGTADNSPALIVGGASTSTHIEIDFNKVMAKATGTTTAELKLNPDGGAVSVGAGGLSVSGTIKEGGTALTDKYAAKSHTHSYAPISHASTATTYGIGTASNYGHIKLSDNYTSSAGAASSGVGASSTAVYNAYNTLNTNKAEKSALGTQIIYGSEMPTKTGIFWYEVLDRATT